MYRDSLFWIRALAFPRRAFSQRRLRCLRVPLESRTLPPPRGRARPDVCSRVAGSFRVGDSGFEPLTSSASRKRSPPELIALCDPRREAAPGIEPGYRVLQTLA